MTQKIEALKNISFTIKKEKQLLFLVKQVLENLTTVIDIRLYDTTTGLNKI
jgi:hypothetical protein